jgi:hypothetical protein
MAELSDTGTSTGLPPPPPLAGVGVAAGLVAAIAGWFALAGLFLTEASLFGGLLMLWYWANFERMALPRLLPSILGALVGIGLAWGMFYGLTQHGPLGLAVGLSLLIVAIYLDIVKLAPLFINGATMLFSIVAAAPLVQLKVDWVELCLSAAGGGLFFGGLIALLKWLAGRKATTSADIGDTLS